MTKKGYCWNHFFSECISKHQIVSRSFLLLLPILWLYFPVDMEYIVSFLPPAVLWGCWKLGTVVGIMEYGVKTLTKDFLGVGNMGQRFEIPLPADLANSSSNLSQSICSTQCSRFIKVVTLNTRKWKNWNQSSSFLLPKCLFILHSRYKLPNDKHDFLVPLGISLHTLLLLMSLFSSQVHLFEHAK